MTLIEKLLQTVSEKIAERAMRTMKPRISKPGPPRSLNSGEVEELLESATYMHRPYDEYGQQESFVTWLENRHPGRTGRLRRDIEWIKCKAIKRGEEVRWWEI